MSPLVFSLVPRSHEWYACAEKHRMPVAVSIPFQLLFSGPRSSVMVCFAYFGTSLNRIPTASTVAALFFPDCESRNPVRTYLNTHPKHSSHRGLESGHVTEIKTPIMNQARTNERSARMYLPI